MNKNDEIASKALGLFDQYAEMSEEQLTISLSQLKVDDCAVHDQLLQLLAADEQSHSLVSPMKWFSTDGADTQAVQRTQTDHGAIWPSGTQLGAWCIDGVIGLGGMGVIYAAHRADGLYEREIALKSMRSELASPALLQAFAKERTHLAKLEHVAIVSLFDAGISDDGQPWFAMQRVNGMPIDQWCDARRTDLRGRIRLVIEACDAIAYAHAHGILHQDIKPSNLLVTDAAQVKLLDFGLSALLMEHGDAPFARVGISAAYAAPEVFEGAPPSVAIDVYALGVLIYRLLSDGSPRKQAALAGMPSEQRVAHSLSAIAAMGIANTAEVRGKRDARGLCNALRGDLDAIGLRCVAEDPINRYPSIADVRADLQAWLDHKPVAARQAGWSYRAVRFVRRNALAVTAASVLMLLSAGSGWAVLQQHQRASAEAENAEIINRLFEKSLGAATLNLLGTAPLSSQTLLEDVERKLRAAAGHDRPQLLARGLATLARSYVVRGEGKNAERLLLESKRLDASDPLQIARTNAGLAQILNQRGKAAEAERLVREGLAMIPQREGNDDELARIDLELQHAQSRMNQRDPKSALAILDAAVVSCRRLGNTAWPTLAVLLRVRGVVHQSMGDTQQEGRDLRSALVLVDDGKPAVLNPVRSALAMHLARTGRKREAHQLAAEVLINSVKVFGPTHLETGAAWLTIGKTWYICKSDLRRANIALEQSEAIFNAQLGPDNVMLDSVFNMRSIIAMDAQDFQAALRYARRAVEISVRTNGPYFDATLKRKDDMALSLIGLAGVTTGKAQEAYYREADAVLSDIIREGERQGLDMTHAHANRVGPLLFFNRLDEAEQQAQIGIDNVMKLGGETGVLMEQATNRMVEVRLAQRRFDEATALLTSMNRHLPPIEQNPHAHYDAQGILLYVEIERGDPKRIRAQYMKVRQIAERYGFMEELKTEEVPGIQAGDGKP